MQWMRLPIGGVEVLPWGVEQVGCGKNMIRTHLLFQVRGGDPCGRGGAVMGSESERRW